MRKLVACLNRDLVKGPAPIWLMRQAGRYLPEYREVRAKFPDFIEFCLTPSAAAEVSLQPITRFDLDAAIIFSDILVIPHALGQQVKFAAGDGPQVEKITASHQLDNMQARLAEVAPVLAPVNETIRLTRAALVADKAVIGFAGAPFTVASYVLDDKPSQGIPTTLQWLRDQPDAYAQLISILVEATTTYLLGQIAAGADAVQLFDSWAGACPPEQWETCVHGPLAQIVANIHMRYPRFPIILFPRGATPAQLAQFAYTTSAALGLGQDVDMAWAAHTLQPHVAIQGNLNPLLFAADDAAPLTAAIQHIHAHTKAHPGHVWNVGHGLTPATKIDHVQHAVDVIRNLT